MKALPVAAAVLLASIFTLSPAFSQPPKKDDGKKDQPKADDLKKESPKPPPMGAELKLAPAVTKPFPESIADLKAIQEQTKKVVAKVMPAVVGIQVKGAFGSGVIVSKDGIVLTAGHVSGLPGQKCDIILPSGRKLEGKSLGRDSVIDSGMFQIVTPGSWDYCEMGKSDNLKPGQWCVAIGHPNGVAINKGRPPVVRVGRILDADRSKIRTDCSLVGGDSGGPLFDMQGKVIGIHSRIDWTISSNFHVPIDTYTTTWDRLVKGEQIRPSGSPAFVANRAYLGVMRDDDAKDCRLADVTEGSPAEKAGLKPGDVITKFDGKDIKNYDDLLALLAKKKPGDEIDVTVKRSNDVKNFRVRLETRNAKLVPPYLGVIRDDEAPNCKLSDVTEGSPADKAGLKAGDVVTKFDGKEVKTYDELLAQLGNKKPGDEVDVIVKRGSATMTIKVKLGKKG